MTSFESKVMSLVIERRSNRPIADLPKTLDEFAKVQKNRNFSATFNHVLHQKLTDEEIEILKLVYKDETNPATVAKKLSISTQSITACIDFVISVLAETATYKELCVGSEHYCKMFSAKRREIESFAYPKEKDIYIKDLPLNFRAMKCLCRELKSNSVSARTAVKTIPNLLKLKGCGRLTALHIVNVFKSFNIPCDHWEYRLYHSENGNIIKRKDF